MEASEFSKELDKALALCRSAAALKLPIEAMIEHVADGIEARKAVVLRGEADKQILSGNPSEATTELEALREILWAVGDVAAIGSKLPAAEPDPAELPCPLPANLRRA